MSYKTVRIAIDCMGGDTGIDMTIDAVCKAAKEKSELFFLLYGDEKHIKEKLQNQKIHSHQYSIHHKDVSIAMDERPAVAVKKGLKQSSMAGAIHAIKTKEADAAVSAGNTGALIAFTKLILKTIYDIDRPIIASLLPTHDKTKSYNIMMDMGGNIDADEKQLLEMCIFGETVAKAIGYKTQPRIGILNIGSEDIKGPQIERNANTILLENDIVEMYCGFLEANEIFGDKCDVFVTNGYVGNMILKASEGAASTIYLVLKDVMKRSWFNKFLTLLSIPLFLKVKRMLKPEVYNGGILLGINGIVIKSHGNSTAEGFYYSILRAAKFHESKLTESINQRMEEKSELIKDIFAKNLPSS